MLNAFTIDIEDYWSVFSRDWLHKDIPPSAAVVKNTEWFIETMERFNVKATFFVLGDVAKKFPGLIKNIAQTGHEIGSHGLSHMQIFKLNEDRFRSEVVDSKKLLEDIISLPVIGYRAPAFSIMHRTQWALEVLAQEGYKYDSSVFPISGKRYGWPGFSKEICKLNLPSNHHIYEVPLSTVRFFGKDWPVGGGGYLRLLPYIITSKALKSIQKHRPVIVYMHPYEIDTETRPFEIDYLSAEDQKVAIWHHKMQLIKRNTVSQKLVKLLSEFEFAPIQEVIKNSYRFV